MSFEPLPFEQTHPNERGQKRHARGSELLQIEKDQKKNSVYNNQSAIGLKLDVFSLSEAALRQSEWTDLAARALEPNIFYEPAFILPATQCLPQPVQPSFLFIWDKDSRLVGIFPFTCSKLDFGLPVLRGWQDVNTALGTPLIDADQADNVLGAMLDFSAKSAKNLFFPKIYENGLFSQALQRVASLKSFKVSGLHKSSRAFLNCTIEAKTYFEDNWSRKKIRDLARQRRRLSKIGSVEHKTVTAPNDISKAIEQFLELESSGWKGKSGTALLQKAGKADFARSMISGFSVNHKIEIHELYCNGGLVASGIMLKTPDKAWFWKIAHNEKFEKFSPGVLLVENLTRYCLSEGHLLSADSCAVQNHPMIDSLWTDRTSIVNWMVGSPDRYDFGFKIAVIREKLFYKLKQILRAAYIKLKKAKNN